ncbi:hypothetical protein LMH87_003319 [Akanthomyces muscarius]|uniref:Uncharacterized protein n=1 Tax=Akanthomyces muscarius TaxID=2231603 RepID=A0A9W8Q3C9_AKAMU|nr:hypothetical protein LMH87_003319 [Akanthomyces muscarius]KAJ4144437.1 hypothetical protein LMH87_003319 [Akanthomyces muscarius]
MTLGLEDRQANWIASHIAFLDKCATQGRHAAFLCAIETIVLHVTREQAANFGLFGRLGEDVCQLVDIDTSERIRQYYEF